MAYGMPLTLVIGNVSVWLIVVGINLILMLALWGAAGVVWWWRCRWRSLRLELENINQTLELDLLSTQVTLKQFQLASQTTKLRYKIFKQRLMLVYQVWQLLVWLKGNLRQTK